MCWPSDCSSRNRGFGRSRADRDKLEDSEAFVKVSNNARVRCGSSSGRWARWTYTERAWIDNREDTKSIFESECTLTSNSISAKHVT